MAYIVISLLATIVTTYLVYKFANSILGVHLQLTPLLLCAGCALFISLVIPRIIVGYAGIVGTAVVVTVAAVIFAYYVAYYDDQHRELAPPIEPQGNLAIAFVVATTPEADAVSNPETDGWVDFPMMTDTAIATPKSDSLEDLLEYGFQQKENHNYPQALHAFRTALKTHFESEVAPSLIVEIGNILKNRGAYDEAIQIFTYGRTLPELEKKPILGREFTDTIAYLRIVKNVLLQQHLGFVPFKDLSADTREKIETEFYEWHKLS